MILTRHFQLNWNHLSFNQFFINKIYSQQYIQKQRNKKSEKIIFLSRVKLAGRDRS